MKYCFKELSAKQSSPSHTEVYKQAVRKAFNLKNAVKVIVSTFQ